jgi:hypothetical protein
LRQQLWPKDTFVGFNHGLNAAIKRLRDALGESADSPLFIETLPRLRYRFIANTGLWNEPTAAVRTSSNFRKWGAIAIGAIVCIVFVAALSRRFTNLSRARMTISPLVTNPGERYYPSLSPTGEQLVFAWNGGSGAAFSLYEKVVGSEYAGMMKL